MRLTKPKLEPETKHDPNFGPKPYPEPGPESGPETDSKPAPQLTCLNLNRSSLTDPC